ncbi:MAG TPA: hypothetical protein VFY93_17450 [Planctomycetota bacterium]|nr:hypothetical protein [Planctomycetota bacterium]
MARVEGAVAGAADYLCRFCEVAVHVKPDGRETVSFRIAGERHEFDLVEGGRLSFPLPGEQPPEDVIVPVSEAAIAGAPGAGHPVTLPGHPVGLPGHPVTLPAAPVGLPAHPVELPGHPVELPAHAVTLPEAPVNLPGHPVELPAHAVVVPRQGPVSLPGHPVRLPGHPVGLPGHPVTGAVTLTRAAAPTDAPRTVEVIVVPPEPSRFCTRTPMPSVLRGSR